ncbi:TetR/AcrR family transcriptional regulator [Granulosicoccus antarcticus]|uniref:HTH-type transcriptional repressor ComR n=1 Tax=Granulosicoccus antarcticus IMCC3135 TaxID=1192854 RepID=A0A2Z2NTC8_9GAMM|nr:TetR/AcrR family transcriptional regulator [Granulosicoccus antarcticus]ASJ70857.1 HTH-type transcriptional repressor ComR [Granulosicoccus antarcticus IMCC3135]
MNVTKKAGRPKLFDKNEALLAAVNVFWERGYEGASVKNLTEAMGINSPSLYAEFGDKHNLYLQAIDCYANNDACAPLVAIEGIEDIHVAVRAFLDAAINYSTDHDSGAKGCFLVSCVSTSAGHVEGVSELLYEAIAATDARITARFDLEKKKGGLSRQFPSAERARLLFDLRQGLVFRARAGVSAKVLSKDLANLVQLVLADSGK